jgi:hypothetical protein
MAHQHLKHKQYKLRMKNKWVVDPRDPPRLFRKLFPPSRIEVFDAHWGKGEIHYFYYSRDQIAKRVRQHRRYLYHSNSNWESSARWLLDYLRLREFKVTIITEVRFGVRTAAQAAALNPQVHTLRKQYRRVMGLTEAQPLPADPAAELITQLTARYEHFPLRQVYGRKHPDADAPPWTPNNPTAIP